MTSYIIIRIHYYKNWCKVNWASEASPTLGCSIEISGDYTEKKLSFRNEDLIANRTSETEEQRKEHCNFSGVKTRQITSEL